MAPRTSSLEATHTRKARGSMAVTATAASGSSGRPTSSRHASPRSGVRKPVACLAGAAQRKKADLPPKSVEPVGPPTRSLAHSKQGGKEGSAMGKVGADQKAGKPEVLAVQAPPAVALVEPAEGSAREQRKALGSPSAIAAATSNSELLGPVTRYVGLDIGKSTEFCEVRQEQVTARATVRKEADLEARLGPGTARALVVFEACREMWHLYDLLTGWGHEVWVVDTTRVRQLGIGQHKRKNDRIDAEALARAGESGRVPRAYVLSHASQRLRVKLGVRRALVETRAQYVTTIRSLLRSEGLTAPSCETHIFVRKLEATELPGAVREAIKPLVVALEAIGPQIQKVDEDLEKHCSDQPIVQLLASAPGVGRIVAAVYVSVIDTPLRFRTAHQVEAYLGLVPSEATSGKRKLGAITKQGNSYLRSVLTQAAWSVVRLRASDPLKSWGQAIAKRRGKRVAVIAIARRLAGILWAMWRDNSHYDPSNVGKASARGKRQEAQQTEQTASAIEAAGVSARRA